MTTQTFDQLLIRYEMLCAEEDLDNESRIKRIHRSVRISTAKLITSQGQLYPHVVTKKREEKDYFVQVSPLFNIGPLFNAGDQGIHVRAIMDGHHSLAAADADGVKPRLEEWKKKDHSSIAFLDRNDVNGFLGSAYRGDHWRWWNTQKSVF